LASLREARFRRRTIDNARPASPATAMVQVAGSGTAVSTCEIPYMLLLKLLGTASVSTHSPFDLFARVNEPALHPVVNVLVQALVS